MATKRRRRRKDRNRRGNRSQAAALRRLKGRTEAFLQEHASGAIWGSSPEKMSEVVLDFAEPLLERAQGAAATEGAIGLAVLAWNAAFLPVPAQVELIEDAIASLEGTLLEEDAEVFLGIFGALVLRRMTEFADVQRFIIDFEVTHERSGDLHLAVSSSPVSPVSDAEDLVDEDPLAMSERQEEPSRSLGMLKISPAK